MTQLEAYREIAQSGDKKVIDNSIAFLEDQRKRYGLTLEDDACLRVLKNPDEITLFDSMDILKPE